MSRAVTSSQQDLHPALQRTVQRHLTTPFRRPFPGWAEEVFARASATVERHGGPLILDSFCGVGDSTRALAAAHPQALVIGFDKSAARLARRASAGEMPGNCLLLRADAQDFWRQAATAGWRLQSHWLLYPNPWPKPAHLQRRVHGSAQFPALLQLGGIVELRSNWELYVREFARALGIAGVNASVQPLYRPEGLTPFERKYAAAGHRLWRCTASLTRARPHSAEG